MKYVVLWNHVSILLIIVSPKYMENASACSNNINNNNNTNNNNYNNDNENVSWKERDLILIEKFVFLTLDMKLLL